MFHVVSSSQVKVSVKTNQLVYTQLSATNDLPLLVSFHLFLVILIVIIKTHCMSSIIQNTVSHLRNVIGFYLMSN